MMIMKRALIFAVVLLSGFLAVAGPAEQVLSLAHSAWLEEVTPVLTETERDVFLKLRTDAERDKFIRFFWRQRDPLPDTPENEYYKEYMERVRFADRYFGIGSSRRGSQTERGFYYLVLGKPLERNIFATFSEFWPLELWFYKGEEAYGLPPYFYLIFYQPEGIGDYRLYYPGIDGPEKLVIPNVGSRVVTRASAKEVLRKTNSELAGAAMSYLPGDNPFGSGSFSSDNIIAAARALPGKKFNDAYARGYMNYKDYVETDYADNYIGAGAKVRLFRTAGQPFLHWSIEPDRMSFAQRGDVFYAGFELVVRMEDLKGSLVLEKTEDIPVRLTSAQYKANERRRFAFQDLLPLVPGDHKLFFLFKNKTSKEFTSFETTVSVPRPDAGPGLSSLLLIHGRERVPEGQGTNFKPFSFDGFQCVVSAKNEFLPEEKLEAYIQVFPTKEIAADPGASLAFTVAALDGGAVVREKRVALTEAVSGPGGGVYFGPFALADIKPGYYRADVSLVVGDKAVLAERENFIVLANPYPVLPWVYAKVHNPFPSAEHLGVLGSQHFMAGEYDAALDLFRRSLKMKDDPVTGLYLGKSLFALGRFRESLAELGPRYEATQDRETAKVIALDHAGLKDWASALIYLDKLMAEATEISVLNLAAECHMNLGEPGKALPLIEKSLSLDPSQPLIREMEERAKKE
jgi:GWxTD domain-containing protein